MLDPLSQAEWVALILSLQVAIVGVLVALPFGFAIAWLLARVNFPGKFLLDSLVAMPLVLPPVATGYILLMTFGLNAPLGHFLHETFGLRLVFDWTGAALVAAIMGFPLMVRTIRLSLETIDYGIVDAARTLGATPFRAFITIIVPLSLPGLLAGTVLAFARALGEFGATIAFVGNIPGQTQTLPLALYSVLQSPGGDALGYRLVLISALLAIASLAVAEFVGRFLRRKLTGSEQ
ncbi:MAG: molybdate ABC transporter permease subunit [Parvibaculum sp.]